MTNPSLPARAPERAADSSAEPLSGGAVKERIGAREFVVMMALLMATNAYAIDVILPALEEMKAGFHISGLNSQHYVIFAFLGGFGFAQLIFGPLADCFGRRPPLLLGLALYTALSFACAFAPDFTLLLVLRALQGAGAAAMRVIAASVIRDIYSGRKMAEIMSAVMMVFMVVPIAAPACGNFILHFGAWQTIFYFMALAGLLTFLWVFLRLPETLRQKRPLSFRSVGLGFSRVLGCRMALCYSLAFSVLLGALFCALTTAPQIYDGIYHLGAWFPAAFAAVALFQALAAYFNARFVMRFGMRKLSHGMLLSFISASALWCFWSWAAEKVPFPAYMALFTVIMFSFGAIGANFNSLAMEPLGKYAGTASSVFGFMQIVIGAAAGFAVSLCFNGTTLPIAAGFLCIGLLALLFVLAAEKGRLFGSGA